MTRISIRTMNRLATMGSCALLLAACGGQTGAPAGVVEAEASQTAQASPVRYHFLRNATARLDYAGQTILLDPMLSGQGELPSFAGIAPNPTVALPLTVSDAVAGIDAVIVGHMHVDHFDPAAAEALPKDVPVFTPDNSAPTSPPQPEPVVDFRTQLQDYGFTDVSLLDGAEFEGVSMEQEFARHGSGNVAELMGGVNGIVLSAPGHPRIYWTGDTVLDGEGRVEAILTEHAPDIVIAHTGGAVIAPLGETPLMMDEAQAVEFFQAAHAANPEVQIVAVHMNALDHCFTTRETLAAEVEGLPADLLDGLHMPVEGETVVFD